MMVSCSRKIKRGSSLGQTGTVGVGVKQSIVCHVAPQRTIEVFTHQRPVIDGLTVSTAPMRGLRGQSQIEF